MILLDTHILVWAVSGDNTKLSQETLDNIDEAINEGEATVSAATFWELELKRRKPRGNLPFLPPTKDLRSGVLKRGLAEIPISGSLWVDAVSLIDVAFHQDPADQLIVASAIRHGCELVTMDTKAQAWAQQSGQLKLLKV